MRASSTHWHSLPLLLSSSAAVTCGNVATSCLNKKKHKIKLIRHQREENNLVQEHPEYWVYFKCHMKPVIQTTHFYCINRRSGNHPLITENKIPLLSNHRQGRMWVETKEREPARHPPQGLASILQRRWVEWGFSSMQLITFPPTL